MTYVRCYGADADEMLTQLTDYVATDGHHSVTAAAAADEHEDDDCGTYRRSDVDCQLARHPRCHQEEHSCLIAVDLSLLAVIIGKYYTG